MPRFRIALTGGIAAGKSTVAAHLAELGAHVIDYDSLAREVVAPGSVGSEKVFARFPPVRAADGSIDRAALAAIVFADDDARADLEAITHPLICERAAALDAAAPGVVVHDIPLLAEIGAGNLPFDAILTVEADEDTRIARLIESRGMSRADATARMRAQASDEHRRAIATHVIDANVPRAQMVANVTQLYRELADSTGYDDLRGEYSRDR
ncbi:dephospho-CoA kinase [Bowdeniella nasicola]|uniref:Dephospho-CoA kinase n=1 Tax=Bowdeniella nasicola TaxID=208480 RepID=A0A1Q5Q4Y1_9ACTO|nr:dephospho-CoA kinase [Bowdeniella nasicola]OKL54843.1 dephospho-CoA kinase [Bowdeniella nasicola]